MTVTPSDALKLGWSIIPVKRNKLPFVRWRKNQETRADENIVAEWQAKLKPPAWAVVTGAISGIFVLDFDGEDGKRTLAALGLEPHVRTGSGGSHLYFRHPGFAVRTVNRKSLPELGDSYPGLDIKGDGGYAIFAGSNEHGTYEWLREPDLHTVDQLPEALQDLLQAPAPRAPEAGDIPHEPAEDAERWPVDDLLSRALERASGGRNAAGFWLACQLRDNRYSYDEAQGAMLQFQAAVPGVNTKGQAEPYTRKEALSSLDEAFGHSPREPLATPGEQVTIITGKPRTANARGRKPRNTGTASVATELLVMAAGLITEAFTSRDGRPYALVAVDGLKRALRTDSREFSDLLRQRYRQIRSGVPTREAVKTAVEQLSAEIRQGGDVRDVFMRVAQSGDRIFLDLADRQCRSVEVSGNGWRVIDMSPVPFERGRGALPLPEPVHGGSVEVLRPLVNSSDEHFILLVAFLLGCLQGGGPYPPLVLSGEQGSSKSTVSRMVKDLIDPAAIPLRLCPREDRDVLITATNNHIIAYDNLSGMPHWLSDVLASLATGTGYSTRELYTDHQEATLSACRPVVINGITDLVERSDLLDRCLLVTLRSIPDKARIGSGDFWERFESVRPTILGGLLDAVSAALRNIDSTQLAGLPRMADFARFVTAAEEVLPWETGSFLRAYAENRASGHHLVLEGNVVAERVIQLAGRGERWTGRMSDLYRELAGVSIPDGFPKDASRLSGQLRRLSPNLRQVGIEVSIERSKSGSVVTLEAKGDADDAGDAVPPMYCPCLPREKEEREKKEETQKQGHTNSAAASPASPATSKRRVTL